MRLTPHFTLEELTVSETAARKGMNNNPPELVLPALNRLAEGLETVRFVLGERPLVVTSGYRSPEVNDAIGGSKGSQHMRGEAADFICPGYGSPREVFTYLAKSVVNYDQIILEYERWVHISFSANPRRKALVIDGNGVCEYPVKKGG